MILFDTGEGEPRVDLSFDIVTYQSEELWLAAREGSLGATSAAVAMNEGYESPLEWVAQRQGRIERKVATLPMKVGQHLEEFVAREAEKQLAMEGFAIYDPGRWTILRPRAEGQRHRHATIDRLVVSATWAERNRSLMEVATPKQVIQAAYDGLGAVGILEIKTTSSRAAKRWEDGPPAGVIAQLQHQLFVADLDRGWIAVMIGNGEDLRVWAIERDDAHIDEILAAEDAMYAHIAAGTLPTPAGSEGETKALTEVYSRSNETEIILPKSALAIHERLVEIKDHQSELETERRACENQIKAMLGEAEAGVVPDAGVRYRWRTEVRNIPPREATTQEIRVLRVSTIKGE